MAEATDQLAGEMLLASVVICVAAVLELKAGITRSGFVIERRGIVLPAIDVLYRRGGGILLLACDVTHAAILEFGGVHGKDLRSQDRLVKRSVASPGNGYFQSRME